MWIDLAALAVLGLFSALGAWRGALASGGGLACLALGYATGIVAARDLGAPIAGKLGLPALVGAPVAGFAGFLLAFVLGSAVLGWLKRWDRVRRGGLPRGAVDRIAGGGFGALRGGLVVLLVTWLVIWLDAAREMSGDAALAGVPDTSSSGAVAVTQNVVEGALMMTLSDGGSGGRLVARAAARPAESMSGFQSLLEDDRIQALQDDGLFWTYVDHGSIESALNRGSFWRVVHDDALRAELAQLGVISDEAARDPARFREDAGRVLGELGPRIHGLQNDPEVKRLASDPEVVRLLESGDTLGLLRHRGVQDLVARVAR